MKQVFIILLSCLCLHGHAQLTIKDFKLYLDNIACSDTTAKLTRQQMLQANKVAANFSWLTIRSLTIYAGEGNYASETMIRTCNGNIICEESKKIFERILPGTPVMIVVEGYNKQGKKVNWAGLSIIIKAD